MKKFAKKTKTILLIIFISANIVIASPAKAGMWGEDLLSEMIGQMMDEMQQEIFNALLGAFKEEAIAMIGSEIDNLLTGSASGEALFITDWQDWLFDEPRSKTDVYMNDFFTLATRGQSSSVNYDSFGGTGFERWRSDFAKQFIGGEKYSNLSSNFEEYAPSVDQMFVNGNWQAYSEFIGNDHLSLALAAKKAELGALGEFTKEAEVQAGAYGGFKSTLASDGKTVLTPGSTIKNIKDSADAASFMAIAGASSIPEVIVATVSKLATSTIKNGIGNGSNTSTSTSANCLTGDCGNGSDVTIPWTNPDTGLPL